MDTKTYAVVDLETTGHSSAKGDRIIQIAIVLIKEGKVGYTYTRFVNPKQKIPAFIRQLTSISDEDVEVAPHFEEIAVEVSNLLEGTVFVAHNADFDLPFLQAEFARCGVAQWSGKKIDTVELSKIIFPSSPSYRLQDISEELGIPLPSAHRADDDAAATGQLFLRCHDKLNKLPENTLKLLHRRSFQLKSDLSFLFHEALKRSRKQLPTTDLFEFRGIPYKQISKTKQTLSKELVYPIDNDVKTDLFQIGFPEFEKREQQYLFMDAVWNTFQTQSEIIAEVPTGMGKTVGYLLPAAIQSIKMGKPVVVSTYTNHLADKIQGDELDKVRKILDLHISATVLKGRERYISLGKLEELLRIADESYDETFTIMQILVWLTETKTGDLDELNVSGGGQLFVDRIRKRSNRMAQDEQEADFHSALLDKCRASNLIITNHSMLLSDLNRGQVLFHSLSGLVIDEAHQLVQTASQLEKTVFSYMNWKYIMGQIGSEAEGQLLQQVFALVTRFGTGASNTRSDLDAAFTYFTEAFDKAIEALVLFNPTEVDRHRGNRRVHSLSKFNYSQNDFSEVATAMFNYVDKAEAVANGLLIHKENMGGNEQALLSEWAYWIREIKIKAGEWVEIFLDSNKNQFAVWVEKDLRSIPGSLSVIKSPIEGATPIKKFMERMKEEQTGVIWTSGTLSIKNNDRFIPEQLGIDEEVPFLTFQAPDDFYKGAEIFIVEDMPEIQQVPQRDYIEAVADAVIQTVMATGGRLFVLFTSQDMLRKTHDLIVEAEQLDEYAIFAQGITSGSRMRLLKAFRQFEFSILFGTNSFWEGVDVPGEALSAVIVVRLPFSSPSDPIFKARAVKLTEQGMNPFTEYALPEAVMRMRQGFGRLIRSSADKGFFIILDKRIETKSYGSQFIESLPAVPVKKVPLEVMVKELENCYNK